MTELIEVVSGPAFRIFALQIDGACPVLGFLEMLVGKDPCQYLGTMALLDHSARHGPPKNVEKCRPLGEGLFEFKHKHVRLFFFYQSGRIIVCTNGMWKQGPKTPPRDIARAKEFKNRYEREAGNEP